MKRHRPTTEAPHGAKKTGSAWRNKRGSVNKSSAANARGAGVDGDADDDDGTQMMMPLGKMAVPERDWSAIQWSPEQLQVIDAVRNGRNVFATGPGGVGKSTLLPYLVHIMQEEQDKIVRVTATTGIAAVQIGGMTFHSFVGVGLGDGTQADVIRSANNNPTTVQRWTEVDALIIDEISMMDPEFFIKADYVGRDIRKQPLKAFGGMQIILVGDFFQLPPVITDKTTRKTPYEFAFDTPTWWDMKLVNVELKTVFRQQDASFVSTLNRIRYGEHTADDIRLLQTRVNAPITCAAAANSGIEPTVLYSRCRSVDQINHDRLRKLPGPDYIYDYKSGWLLDANEGASGGGGPGGQAPAARPRHSGADVDKYLRRLQAEMLKNSPADHAVTLRLNAQVMLLINLDQEQGLVNGTRGVVVGFDVPSQHPIVRFQNGKEITVGPYNWKRGERGYGEVYFKQIPLKLAWSVTIHKSQGMTLDCSIMSIDDTLFERGQAYVALSRIRSLQGLTLTRFDPQVIRAHPRVVDFYKSGFKQQEHMTKYADLAASLSVHAMQKQMSRPLPMASSAASAVPTATITNFFNKK